MSSWRDALAPAAVLAFALGTGIAAQAEGPYPGIGRDATAREVAAWDIDVRPDFKGLPPGSGSVAQGMTVWEAKCASCHGVFGESNQTFSPLVGGTTAQDIQSGRVARLTDPAFPGRTTLMKVATLSTLWDYIHRAMPWTQPKSLTSDEVYAVTAYLLNLGGVVPDEFTLSDRNMAQTQDRLPNRHGMTTDHGLWPGRGIGNGGKPDVKAVACMKDCAGEPRIVSSLPDFARNAHGNLAQQNRLVGAQRGADTAPPTSAARAEALPGSPASPGAEGVQAALALTRQHACIACHGVDQKIVGPSFRDVAKKYGDRPDAVAHLAAKIRSGGSGTWGSIPMPAQTLSEAEARTIAQWLAGGASH